NSAICTGACNEALYPAPATGDIRTVQPRRAGGAGLAAAQPRVGQRHRGAATGEGTGAGRAAAPTLAADRSPLPGRAATIRCRHPAAAGPPDPPLLRSLAGCTTSPH